MALARLELTPPPNFFTVAIQQPGNSYPSSRLSLLLVGVFWMYKASSTDIIILLCLQDCQTWRHIFCSLPKCFIHRWLVEIQCIDLSFLYNSFPTCPGLEKQTNRIPVQFLLELLNNKKRLVLTGMLHLYTLQRAAVEKIDRSPRAATKWTKNN